MSKQLHVLLVEDSEDDTLLLLRELKRGGYQVEYERVDTPDAMNAALDSRKWDIIIADYVMPHFSGLSALKLLKEKEIDLPFILVSGKIEEDIAVESMKAGAQDFINKHDLSRLVPAIDRELAEADVRLKRKIAEEALRKSEEKYRMIVETTHEGIWILDTSGKTSYVNSRMAQMLGCTVEEMLGRHLFDFMDAPARIDAQIYLERRKQGVTETHDFRFSRKDGTDMWAIALVNPILDEKGQYLGALGMITDISQRKQAEKALRQSEMELLESQRVAQVGSWQWVIASGTFIFSEGLYRIIGRDLALPPPNYKENLEMYTDESAALLDAVMAEAVKNGTPYELDLEMFHPDGSRRFMIERGEAIRDAAGHVIMLRGTLQDITERKKAEKELIQSHELMRNIIEHNRSAIAVHDRDLKYIYVSQRYLDEYKIKEKDIIGKHHYDVFPDLPQKWRDVHQRVLAGEILSAEDDPYVREDGTVDWTRWECRPWYETDGSIGGIIVYTEVITERKRVEDELKKYRDHLEELVKERTVELNKKNEELERFNKLFVGRELRMIELKKQIAQLENELEEIKKNCGQKEEKIGGPT